jgi:decaprenylphospho-beta-D-ribofuranose 2-oxidase
MPRKRVTNWGNYPAVTANVHEGANVDELRDVVQKYESLIARGNGRCYGDSSLGENIVSTLKLNHFLSFDSGQGIIECESGVLFSDILNVIVPKGFFLPVTPGTKYITLGGAIAADVHGKNHHCEGSFSNHVVSLRILTSEGAVVSCSQDENPELFWQTCGGMGLTGIIVSAKFRLKPIETTYIQQISHKVPDIDSVMRLFEDSADHTYSVAWIDCFGRKKNLGRSLLLLGEHALKNQLPPQLADEPLRVPLPSRLNLPVFVPVFSLNYASVKLMNSVYYHKHLSKKSEAVVHFDSYFYPLDGISHWNRAYGRQGFVQYQFVLPKETSYDGLIEILERIERSGQGSPLAVLKLFGEQDPNAVMSFPREGYTLALDFKVNEKVFTLLDELDELVLRHGGRIYLAKDARMNSEIFHKTYSKIVHSNRFRSAQSTRLDF